MNLGKELNKINGGFVEFTQVGSGSGPRGPALFLPPLLSGYSRRWESAADPMRTGPAARGAALRRCTVRVAQAVL